MSCCLSIPNSDQSFGDALPFTLSLSISQHDFKFEKRSESVNIIYVNAGLSDQIERSRLSDYPCNAQRHAENVLEYLGIGCAGDQISRAAGISHVRPLIAN